MSARAIKRHKYRLLMHLLLWAFAISPYAALKWMPPTDFNVANRLLIFFSLAFFAVLILSYIIIRQSRDHDN